jgi:SAM-dependent methyltransferase
LPWPDGRFSAVACTDAFPFFPDPERALAEMCRILRPGGRAVIDVNPRVPDGIESHRFRGPAGEFWAWDAADVHRMMAAAGFDDVVISYARPGGDNRLVNYLIGRMLGTNEETIVAALKPSTALPVDDARADEAVAVG